MADRPDKIVEGFRLGGDQGALPPATAILAPEDLPERVEAWGALDRLIWQDVDTARLSPAQVTALRGWLAGGGRLIVVGGTAGPASLAGLPDAILPYRPTATIDAPAETLRSLLGTIPVDAVAVPALAGSAGEGRTLATVGDRVIAAERRYGNGAVAIVGIDPTASWIAASKASDALWRSLVPGRSSSGDVSGTDDSFMVQAVASLPSLALPPIGGLIILLFGYILLIGPINYLVLRRLDRRDWAWLTMPVLIVVFAVGAYAFGSALRGGEVLINEVAVVRGAPDVEEGLGSVYVGIFSPNRGRLPGPGPRRGPAERAGQHRAQRRTRRGRGSARPAPGRSGPGARPVDRVRVAADDPGRDPAPGPAPDVRPPARRWDAGRNGHQRVDSEAPGRGHRARRQRGRAGRPRRGRQGTGPADDGREPQNFGQSLSDRILGQPFFDGGPIGSEGQTAQVRHAVIDQLTFDPNFGPTSQLQADGPVVLAWADGDPLPIEIVGQTPRRSGQTMYYVPLGLTVKGPTVFTTDLVRTTVVASDAGFFNKGPFDMSFGQGTVTVAYRPIAFGGTLDATKVVLGMNTDPSAAPVGGGVGPIASPSPSDPAGSGWQLRRRPQHRAVRPDDRRLGPAAPHLRPGGGRQRARPLRRSDDRDGPRSPVERAGRRRRLPVLRPHRGQRPMSSIVRATGLVKRYDRTLAVAGLDLDIAEGEIFGLVGPNGAGKTTVLRMLATLLVPTAGDAEIAGASVRTKPDDVRRAIGFMPDTFGVYDDMRVWEYLDFFARCYGIPADRRRTTIADLLDLVDLADKRDAYVQALSRGMQQRLCLAHALVHDPQVLLLDEPASGLDPRARVELRELLRELRALGKTILISSHILPELEELCTSVAIVDRGQVLAQGRVADIERRLRVGAVLRIRVLAADVEALEAARAWFETDPDVASAAVLEDGTIELGFRGDDEATARLLGAAVRSGLAIVTFSRAASDLEELFLQVTGAVPEATPSGPGAPPSSAPTAPGAIW